MMPSTPPALCRWNKRLKTKDYKGTPLIPQLPGPAAQGGRAGELGGTAWSLASSCQTLQPLGRAQWGGWYSLSLATFRVPPVSTGSEAHRTALSRYELNFK